MMTAAWHHLGNVKYGALKGDTGSLAVTWEVLVDRRDRRRLALSWVESGVAIEPKKVTRRGYGTELIQEALGCALETDVDYELSADGVRCRIEMPINQPGCTRVRVRRLASRRGSARGASMPDHALSLDGRRVLIVEDEYLIAMEVKGWLQHAGAKVVGPVPSVERALDLIEDDDIDAAVLDFNLGDGATALPIAARLDALGVPHLFATGDVQLGRGSSYEDRPRLEKPFVEAELVRAVGKLIAPA
jgi:CheY-like chemotaxis protein